MKLVPRLNLLRLTSLTAMTLLAGSALADLPPAMDRAPKVAAVTIVIRDVGGLKGKVEGLAAKFGAPMDGPMEQLGQFLEAAMSEWDSQILADDHEATVRHKPVYRRTCEA